MLTALYDTPLLQTPEKPAIIFNGRRLTYAELDEMVPRSAAALAGLGVGRGDRVALFMGNRPELPILDMACFAMGAVAVPLNSRFQVDEVVHACVKSSPRVLIADADRRAKVAGVQDRAPSLEHVFILDGGEASGPVKGDGDGAAAAGATAAASSGDASTRPWSEALAAAPNGMETSVHCESDHPALIMFTSGSTGKPKGVTHTHGSILAHLRSRVETQRLESSDVTLIGSLVCHVAGSMGMTFPTLHAGGSVVLLEAFEPEVWLDAVAEHRPTRALLLPTQMLDALEHEAVEHVDFGSFREIEVGGSVVTHHLRTLFRETTGHDLREVYGLTECEGACLQRYWEPAKIGSVGKPREGVDIRLVDKDGADVGIGEIGEIWLSSESIMAGYWEDPEHTAAAFSERWFRTGDLARRDEDDHIHFVGRDKEMIIKGGSNIAPDEIEEVLDDHPDVECSAVVGVPDARMGELIHAFVEIKPGSRGTVEVSQLRDCLADHVAEYKVPDRWTILDALPRNQVGKLDYAALHAMAARPAD